MNTKLLTIKDSKTVTSLLMSAHKLISNGHTVSGFVESFDYYGSPIPIHSTDASLSKLNALRNFSNSHIAQLVTDLKRANDIVNKSEAVDILKRICINDINNEYFDKNVTDSSKLETVGDSNIHYFRATPSWVKPLESKYVDKVIKGIINNDAFIKAMKNQDPQNADELISMIK